VGPALPEDGTADRTTIAMALRDLGGDRSGVEVHFTPVELRCLAQALVEAAQFAERR